MRPSHGARNAQRDLMEFRMTVLGIIALVSGIIALISFLIIPGGMSDAGALSVLVLSVIALILAVLEFSGIDNYIAKLAAVVAAAVLSALYVTALIASEDASAGMYTALAASAALLAGTLLGIYGKLPEIK